MKHLILPAIRRADKEALRVFYQCGGCDQYHPAWFTGDCRDDEHRYNPEDLPEGWEEVGQEDESYITN